jgi:hypothetical protein
MMTPSQTNPHLLVFKVKDLQKEGHLYEEIAKRIKERVESAWQVSQNAFLIPHNTQFNEAEQSFFGVLPKGAQYFNFVLCPPVFAHCDSETQKRLHLLGLDPYCTTSE